VIRTILFPTDFTEIATQAGRYAEYLALKTGARLIVVHTIEPVLLPGTEDDQDLQEFSRELEARARQRVEEIVQPLRTAGVDAEGQVLVGHTFDILEALVKSAQVDLIVMGSHSMAEGTEPAVGTLSHRLFFLSKAPILFIR
jgi:nucleotide-binding universal stress UspA family protein